MSEMDKGRAKSPEARNQMKIKSQGGFQRICSNVRCQTCVCEKERDVWGIQSWPCHAESYFPLLVAQQHQLDSKKWSERDGKRGIKTETGLTLTWYFHITRCFKAMLLLVPPQPWLTGVLFFSFQPSWDRSKVKRQPIASLAPGEEGFSRFNLWEVMALTYIWPWGEQLGSR